MNGGDGRRLVREDEMVTYTLHFEDRDAEGNEYNGGEGLGVDSIDEAARECAERASAGDLFDYLERKVATIDADGNYRWL